MSYEGRERYLCSKGHCWEEDVIYVMYEMPKIECSICKTPPVWKNSIDETNGCESIDSNNPAHDGNCICGTIPLEVLEPVKTHKCDCGNVHITEPTRYKIPSREGK